MCARGFGHGVMLLSTNRKAGAILQMEPFSVLPSFFKKDVIFIYLFLEKGEGREKREGREKEGERNIDVREKC